MQGDALSWKLGYVLVPELEYGPWLGACLHSIDDYQPPRLLDGGDDIQHTRPAVYNLDVRGQPRAFQALGNVDPDPFVLQQEVSYAQDQDPGFNLGLLVYGDGYPFTMNCRTSLLGVIRCTEHARQGSNE